MAYAVKYLFKWESANKTTREIRVLQDGYSGDPIQRPLGRGPVLKKQHNGNVYGTSLEFYAECNVDGEFAEFYTTDPKAYRVDLYAGSTLLWQGYLTPELYSEPDIAPPYDVQLIATDGVGELKLYDFAPQGLKTLRQLLTYLLGYTGLGTDVYLISSLKPGGAGAGSLLEKTINVDYKAGESCYDVLSYLLDTLHATITWWRGAWILTRETNVTLSSGKVRYFNTAGNSALLAGSAFVLGKMYTNDVWPVGQLSTKVDPAKKSVVVQAPWHPVTALANPDMTSDSSWVKTGSPSYVSASQAYHLPSDYVGPTPSDIQIQQISQGISMSGLRVPMTFTGRFSGIPSDWDAVRTGSVIGVNITYLVGSDTYVLVKDDEGAPIWELAGESFHFQQPVTTYGTSEFDAEEMTLEIPPLALSNGTYPAGQLSVMIRGACVYVYSAHLDIDTIRGYQDRLHLDNGARGEGEEVEIAIGRETSDIAYYQAFLQGLLLDSGSLITSFKDDHITSSGLDYMSFIARDYARSIALPRLIRTGTVFLEDSVAFPPLVLTKGAIDYWLEGFTWNMYEDELDISARSLPTATITVLSEEIREASGTGATSRSGGSSSMSGGGVSMAQVREWVGDNYLPLTGGELSGDLSIKKNGAVFSLQSVSDPTNYAFRIENNWSFGDELYMYGGYGQSCFLAVTSTASEIATLALQPSGNKIAIGGPVYFNGVQNISWGYSVETRTHYGLYFQSANPNSSPILFSDNGNLIVGQQTDPASAKLYVAGHIYSTGDQSLASDATQKENLKDISLPLDALADAPAVTFDWKDKRAGRSAGSIAQYWRELIPELVHGEEGNMSLAYGQLALVDVILLAREVRALRKELADLKKEIEDLKK